MRATRRIPVSAGAVLAVLAAGMAAPAAASSGSPIVGTVTTSPRTERSAPAAFVNGDIKSGVMTLTLSPQFSQQLLNSGATVTGIGGAQESMDDESGATVITWRVMRSTDGFSLTPGLAQAVVRPRGGLRITGNGTSVDLTDWNFLFSEAYGMMISATAGDSRPWISTGVPITLPHQLQGKRLSFASPAMTLNGTLGDVLRGASVAGRFTGPVPGFTTEQIPFGTAVVKLKVGR